MEECHSDYPDCWLITYEAYCLGIIEQLVSGLGLGYIIILIAPRVLYSLSIHQFCSFITV